MKRRSLMRVATALLCAVMLLGSVVGCGKDSAGGGSMVYIEKSICDPNRLIRDTVLREDGVLSAVGLVTSGFCYLTLGESGSWQNDVINATKSIDIEKGSVEVCCAALDKGVYFVAQDDAATIYYSEDLQNAAELLSSTTICSPEDEIVDMYDLGGGLIGLHIFHNNSGDYIAICNTETGEIHPINDAEKASRFGNQLLICSQGTVRCVDTTTWEEAPVQTDFVTDSTCQIADGQAIFAGIKGFYRGAPSGSLWIKMFDSTGMSFSNTGCKVNKVHVKGNIIYVYYTNTNGEGVITSIVCDDIRNMEYEGLTGTLRVWSMVDEAVVTNAIQLMKKSNPGLRIEYSTAYETRAESTVASEDAIRALNTELLAGNGPDVIITDYLNVDSYIKGGILADMSGFIDPMVESGELVRSVIDSGRTDGKIYSVPTGFGLPVIMGDPELMRCKTITELCDKYEAMETDKRLMGSVDFYDEAVSFYLPLYYNSIAEDGKIDNDQLRSFVEGMSRLGKLCSWGEDKYECYTLISSLSEEPRFRFDSELTAGHTNLIELAQEQTLVAPCELDKIVLLQIAMETAKKDGIEIISNNNSCIPHRSAAICSGTGNMDAAQAFVKCMLSAEIGMLDIPDGFTVNRAALDKQMEIEQQKYTDDFITIDDSDVPLATLKEKDCKWFIDTVNSVDKQYYVDLGIIDMFTGATEAYFDGTGSLDECIDTLSSKLTTYVAEN